MSRKSKPKMITLTEPLLSNVERVAAAEGRNFSDLTREALRQYVDRHDEKQRRTTEN